MARSELGGGAVAVLVTGAAGVGALIGWLLARSRKCPALPAGEDDEQDTECPTGMVLDTATDQCVTYMPPPLDVEELDLTAGDGSMQWLVEAAQRRALGNNLCRTTGRFRPAGAWTWYTDSSGALADGATYTVAARASDPAAGVCGCHAEGHFFLNGAYYCQDAPG